MENTYHWLESHLLACPIKAAVGMDCPGCGFQRSFMALLRGDLASSWDHYPPLLPFLATLVLLVIALRSRIPYRMHALAASVAATGAFIVVSYMHKML
jgi:Protein of unknown function (DUF2752)